MNFTDFYAKWGAGGTQVNLPEVVAHFPTQCLFCCFVDDVDLLPQRLFEGLVAK